MADYEFLTVWRIHAPLQSIWEEIFHAERWPTWWRGVESVVEIQSGGNNRVGTVYRNIWKSRLPYKLRFDVQLTRVEPMSVIECVSSGELHGTGRWQITAEGDVTVARFDWKVETTRWWMNLLAPIAWPLFRWNHSVLMDWGAQGLAKRLGATLVGTEES